MVNGYTTQHRCWGRQWFSQSQWVRKCQQQFQQIKYFFGLKPCCVKSVPELKYFLLIHKSCFVSVACVVVEVNIGSAGVHESTEAETKSSPFQFFGHKSHSVYSVLSTWRAVLEHRRKLWNTIFVIIFVHRSCCRENLRRWRRSQKTALALRLMVRRWKKKHFLRWCHLMISAMADVSVHHA